MKLREVTERRAGSSDPGKGRRKGDPKYWISPLGDKDDFGVPYKDEMIDGKTRMGPWGNMTPESWKKHGVGKLGTGYGQRYKKQANGKWLKVEG